MKTCVAGHDLIAFGSARCPLCAEITKADKRIFQLETLIDDLKLRIKILTNEKVSNLKENWNGGAA